MSRRRVEHWFALAAVAGVGLLMTAIAGLFVFVNVTTTPIHQTPDEVPSTATATPPPRWTHGVERAREIVRRGTAEQNLPGVSVAVGAGGEIVWAEGFGFGDLDARAPVAPDTRFRIGTTSIVLTSAAVGVLLERGSVSLDDPIQKLVPAFPRKPWPITLRHLMGHTAGVRGDAGDEEAVDVHCQGALDALPRFAPGPLLFEPGTQYHFSSYGWILVSGAVETGGNQPFDAFMREHVLEPLGMRDTRANATIGTARDQAGFYFPRFAADTRYGPQETDDEDFSCFAGAGAFVSTPSDLVRFGIAMGTGALLRPATVALLQTAQHLSSGQDTGDGLGWNLETVTLNGRQVRAVGHDGALRGGRVSSFMVFPAHDLVVAVTSNTAFADTHTLAVKVAEAFAAVSDVR